ncbi:MULTISPECIES: hypothetical protein [Streptomyces]|uniref:hypothetical protein n=1 Tax=Streptomyces TaxID=1883 RepID=UPI000519BF3B|nr:MULTISPECIES: hypothetical protein [Streptomyces]KOT47127.1 hypothetical protein ADK43_40335 [Streptomyces rimosus subsp. rimosus]
MSAFELLPPEDRAALAELIGDTTRSAGPDFLLRLGHTVKDCRTHDHGASEDLFCGNLHGWMGERMALVVRRLLDAEAELEKYISREPTVAEEMQHLRRCLNSVYDLCDKARWDAERWENSLPLPEWVKAVEQAADGERPDDPSDTRRRIYIDGKGQAWIDATEGDNGEQYLAQIEWPLDDGELIDTIRERTGGLREIGRTR